jgi:uncharacterized protein (DUF924 family)
MTHEIEQILDYWYGPTREYFYADKTRLALWFSGDEEINKDIQKRFLNIHQRAAKSELNHWFESKDGVLALTIILDQFSRNIYKGSTNAFGCDPLALTIVTQAIELEHDLSYKPLQKLFL